MKELPSLPLERQLVSIFAANREDAFETQRARACALNGVARMLHEEFGLQKWANLGQKHIDHVIERWKAEDTGHRSIEGKLSHLRWLVRKIGKANLVPRSNAELGVEPGPRKTRAGKTVSDERMATILAALEDPRMRMAIHLGRYVGMRAREAMLFRPSRDFDHGDAVATWPRTVEVIKAMPALSEVDKEKVLGGNAMRLFGLNGNGAAAKRKT